MAPDDIHRVARRPLLVGAAAAAATLAGSVAGRRGALASSTPPASPARPSGGHPIAERGVNIDVDATIFDLDYVRTQIAALRDDMNSTAVLIVGSDHDRLIDAATVAADTGLIVWIEVRQFEADGAATLEFLEWVAYDAETLRAEHPDAEIGISVGCELSLFMAGIVPGADFLERGQEFTTGAPADIERYNQQINEWLGRAVSTLREFFGGRLTYTSEQSEQIDWTPFDVVGVDLFRDSYNAANYSDLVRGFASRGKPLMITEFGCCTYVGADELGGMGFMVQDLETGEITPGTVRDEQVQADYLAELLDVYETEGVQGAFVWTFIEPPEPGQTEAGEDLGFSVVRTWGLDADRPYETTGHFEPKASFRLLAERFAAR